MQELWYTRSAKNFNEALPLGNGFLGAMCFGGTAVDRYALNDDTLWSGGFRDRINPDARAAVGQVRRLIHEGRIPEAEELAGECLVGLPEEERFYEPLCDLLVESRTPEHPQYVPLFACRSLGGQDLSALEPETGIRDYRRSLDIETGLHTVSYCFDGQRFERQTFISFPARVLVMRLSGRENRIFLRRGGRCEAICPVGEHGVLLRGVTGDRGIAYCCLLSAVGASVERAGDILKIRGSATVYLTSATDFREGPDYLALAEERLRRAEEQGFERLLTAHLADFTPPMARCRLTLEGCARDELPTDARLAAVRAGAEDPGLTALLFSYGRYLLLSSSRPGSLPANLQGIWNEDDPPAWGSKYTININLEMNYWPAEVCGLPELCEPLFSHIRRMIPHGRETARRMYGARGWMAHHNTDLWGDCAPQDNYLPATFWPLGGAWLCLHLWEHYEFSRDLEFLREAYPVLEEAASFFADVLDDRGRLCPSVSPENTYRLPDGTTGCLCDDAAMDQQILDALFGAVCEAASLLGEDASVYAALREKLTPVQVAEDGRLREWLSPEKQETEPGHRHMSHLFALYPGSRITQENPALLAAARKTLDCRLAHGGGHTGWSRVWLLHFMARLGDGAAAGAQLQALLEHSLLPNLLDDHPPFQIDGNFGAVSGIAELLLQSHGGVLRLLPALPPEWRNGSVTGLRARGGCTVSLWWRDGRLERAELLPQRDGLLRLADGRELPCKAGERIVLE